MRGNQVVTAAMAAALLLGGCAKKAPILPADPTDRAATCADVAAATERGAAGAKGNLSADAQARIFHYALLAGAANGRFDDDAAQAVFKREPALFDATIKGKWQTLKPACAAAFPATRTSQPVLPTAPLDSALQCYMLADFMRKAFGSLGGSFGDAAIQDGLLVTKLDPKVAALLKKAGSDEGAALKGKRDDALAAAAKLGQPPAVLAACRDAYLAGGK